MVKAVISVRCRIAPRLGRALYFTRATAPSGDGPVYHHIGIYAYRRADLERFAALPPSPLEQRERLEQLRALEAGMSIGVALVDTVPLGVDTPADLERARALFGRRNGGTQLTAEPDRWISRPTRSAPASAPERRGASSSRASPAPIRISPAARPARIYEAAAGRLLRGRVRRGARGPAPSGR